MDLKKLTRAEMIICASAIVLFLSTFLDWFSVSLGPFSVSANGWDIGFFWAGIPSIIGLVMLAHIATTRFGGADVKLPDLPWDRVHLVGGIVAAVIVLLKLLIGEDEGGIDVDRELGLFLASIAAVGLAVGGFLRAKEQGAGAPGLP